MNPRFLSLALCWALAANLFAQERYVIQIGNFLEPRAEDFTAIQPAGFIHAGPSEAGVVRIMLGGYNDQPSAERALQFVHAQGFVYAYVQPVSLASGSPVVVIQLGTEKSGNPISWPRYGAAGDLYGLMEGNEIKIFGAPFNSVEDAKKKLPEIQQMGFKDAFVKTVNSASLHKLGTFETGLKKPLISLPEPKTVTDSPKPIPQTYDQAPARAVSTSLPGANTSQNGTSPSPTFGALPTIRGNVKRRTVTDLQQALKNEELYNSTLDGFYGNGTATAYEQFQRQNLLMARYSLDSEPLFKAEETAFQNAIYALPEDPVAVSLITSTPTPLAKGYHAYLLFLRNGPSEEVNRLMNGAISDAFQTKTWAVAPPFDYRAAYNYLSLDQVVLHLHFLHSASDIPYRANCSFSASSMARVVEAYSSVNAAVFPYRGCMPFSLWPEIKITVSLAQEIGANPVAPTAQGNQQVMWYHSPAAPRPEEEVGLENWNFRIWKAMDAWAATDAMHQNFARTFKIAYLQSLVRLEDHFMDKGFKPEPSRTLALKTMQLLVGSSLQRFQ